MHLSRADAVAVGEHLAGDVATGRCKAVELRGEAMHDGAQVSAASVVRRFAVEGA